MLFLSDLFNAQNHVTTGSRMCFTSFHRHQIDHNMVYNMVHIKHIIYRKYTTMSS